MACTVMGLGRPVHEPYNALHLNLDHATPLSKPERVYRTPDEHTHYQVDLTGTAETVVCQDYLILDEQKLSGRPDRYG
jgi:hypothetical protein